MDWTNKRLSGGMIGRGTTRISLPWIHPKEYRALDLSQRYVGTKSPIFLQKTAPAFTYRHSREYGQRSATVIANDLHSKFPKSSAKDCHKDVGGAVYLLLLLFSLCSPWDIDCKQMFRLLMHIFPYKVAREDRTP